MLTQGIFKDFEKSINFYTSVMLRIVRCSRELHDELPFWVVHMNCPYNVYFTVCKGRTWKLLNVSSDLIWNCTNFLALPSKSTNKNK